MTIFDRAGQRRGVRKGQRVGEEGLDLQFGIDAFLQPAKELQQELVAVEQGAVALFGLGDDDFQGLGGLHPHAVEAPARAGPPACPFRRGIAAAKRSFQQQPAQVFVAEGVVQDAGGSRPAFLHLQPADDRRRAQRFRRPQLLFVAKGHRESDSPPARRRRIPPAKKPGDLRRAFRRSGAREPRPRIRRREWSGLAAEPAAASGESRAGAVPAAGCAAPVEDLVPIAMDLEQGQRRLPSRPSWRPRRRPRRPQGRRLPTANQ